MSMLPISTCWFCSRLDRLVWAYFSNQHIFRGQLLALLGAFVFPLISCTTYILGIVPVPGMDTTALGFALGGLTIVLRYFQTPFYGSAAHRPSKGVRKYA